MSWFKVDDGFYDHPRVEELPNAAVGLWVKAGAWCAKHETDGVIPASRVRALKGTASQVDCLIRSGLWVQTETDSGAKAYSFRNWFDYQPSHESREEEREVWREKKRKSRARKLDKLRESGNVPEGVPEMSPEETTGGVTEMSGTIPDPTRPDHISKGREEPYGSSANGAGTTPPGSLDELAARHAHTPKAPGVYGTPDDPRCGAHVDLAAEDVPACHACARARQWFQANAKDALDRARDERRAAIAECSRCDDNGMRQADGGLARCNHQPGPADDLPPWEVAQ